MRLLNAEHFAVEVWAKMRSGDPYDLKQYFEDAISTGREEGLAEGERRGREAERGECAEVVRSFGAVHDKATATCNILEGAILARGAVRQTFEDGVVEGSKLGAEAVAKVIVETTKRLESLQWFHDEVSAMLAQKPGLVGMAHLRPILELRADPRYEPIRAARKEGA